MNDYFLDHWGINPDNYDDDDFEEDNDDDFDPSSSALSAAERNA